MAVIKVTNTGSGFSGSIGDIYYRVQNGKQVFCSKPTHYTLPMDDRSVQNRSNMFYLSRISKHVAKDPFFHKMWFLKELKGVGPYHKFFGFNHPHKEDFDIAKVRLSPTHDFSAEVDSFSATESGTVSIKFKALGMDTGIDLFREPFIAGAGFVVQDANEVKNPYEIYTLPLEKQLISFNEPISFSINTMRTIKPGFTLLFLLSTLSSTEEPVKHSKTIICFDI